jgi:hypothetical protein
MSKPVTAMSARRQAQRAAHFKERAAVAERKVSALTRELRDARHTFFAEGSADTMASVYTALNDLHLAAWLSQRLMSLRVRTAPYHLPPEIETMVRRELAEGFKRCEIPDGAKIAAEIEL